MRSAAIRTYAHRPPLPAALDVEEHNNACFIVKDATGQALGYFYFEEEPVRCACGLNCWQDGILIFGGHRVAIPTQRAKSD